MTTTTDTGGSAATESRRLTPSERLHEVTMAAVGRVNRAPSFGITEERGPGGVVVPLFRGEVPVGEEYPTAALAFAALVSFHQKFRRAYPTTNGGTE